MISNLEELVGALAETMREHLAKQLAEIRAEHAIEIADLKAKLSAALTREDVRGEVERQIAEMPRAKDGKDAEVDYPHIFEHLKTLVEALPTPRDGEDAAPVDYERIGSVLKGMFDAIPKPQDGKSVTLADVEPLIASAVDKRVAAIPAPKDAEEVDYDRIGNVIAVAVEKAVGQIPQARDGKDVDYAIVGEMIKASAITAVADLLPKMAPVAREKGVEASDVEAIAERVVTSRFAELPSVPDADAVRDMVDRAVSEIPKAKDGDPGRDFDPELLRAEVNRAVEALPKAEPIDINNVVERAVALMPKPREAKDGKDYDVDVLRAAVKEAVDAIPRPKDGESVHPDTVARLVREEVEKALAGVRLPKDGAPGRDALDLEIVEALDAEKSYPVGTFALHRGGMVMAVRDTDPLRDGGGLAECGWKVTQEGVAAVRAEPGDSDMRHQMIIERTSGATETLEFVTSFANMDKGVYRPGMKYSAGSGVTHDLGFWIAKRDTDQKPPHDDWRLAIKGKHR